MRQHIVYSVLISAILVAGAQAASKEELGEVVTERNESICKQKFTQEIFTQQRIFSSDRNGAKQRRLAERKIEAARNKFSLTASYCDAYDELITFTPETLDRRPGDAMFE